MLVQEIPQENANKKEGMMSNPVIDYDFMTVEKKDSYEAKVSLRGNFWITLDNRGKLDSELRQLIAKYRIWNLFP